MGDGLRAPHRASHRASVRNGHRWRRLQSIAKSARPGARARPGPRADTPALKLCPGLSAASTAATALATTLATRSCQRQTTATVSKARNRNYAPLLSKQTNKRTARRHVRTHRTELSTHSASETVSIRGKKPSPHGRMGADANVNEAVPPDLDVCEALEDEAQGPNALTGAAAAAEEADAQGRLLHDAKARPPAAPTFPRLLRALETYLPTAAGLLFPVANDIGSPNAGPKLQLVHAESSDDCAICLAKLGSCVTTPCGHSFHAACDECGCRTRTLRPAVPELTRWRALRTRPRALLQQLAPAGSARALPVLPHLGARAPAGGGAGDVGAAPRGDPRASPRQPLPL